MKIFIVAMLFASSYGAPHELTEALKKAPEDRSVEEWELFDLRNLRLVASGVSIVSTGNRGELAQRLHEFYQRTIIPGQAATSVGPNGRMGRAAVNNTGGGETSSVHNGESRAAGTSQAVGVGAIRRVAGEKPSRKRNSKRPAAAGKKAKQGTRQIAPVRQLAPARNASDSSDGELDINEPKEGTNSMNEQVLQTTAFNSQQEAQISRMFASQLAEHLRSANSSRIQIPAGIRNEQVSRNEIQVAGNSNNVIGAAGTWDGFLDRNSNEYIGASNSNDLNARRSGRNNIGAQQSNSREFPFGNLGGNAANIPPAPEAVVRKIRQGEFVHLDQLIPGSATSGDNYTITFQANDTAPGTPALKVEPRRADGKKINDFMGWLSAWNTFVRIFLFYFPEKAQEMLFYQASITQLAAYYSFAIWSQYDRAFRMHVAMSPAGRWDTFNEELFNRHIRFSNRTSNIRNSGAAQRKASERTCFTCQQPGHFSAACPSKRQFAPIPPSAPSTFNGAHSQVPASSHTGSSPFPAPQRQGQNGPKRAPCHYFNSNTCNRSAGQCAYDHRCRICGGPHGAANCPSRSS